MEKIDFLPERIKVQRARRASLVRQVCLLGVCLAALAALAYVRHQRIGSAKAELIALKDQSTNMQRQLAFRGELERQQADLMIKKRIDDQLGSRVNALEVLAELERLLPESIVLTSLNLEAVELRVPLKPAEDKASSSARAANNRPKEKVVKRVRLVFTGLAPSDVDLANFIAQLSAGRLFEDINMGYAKNVDFRGRSAREFQASCYVVR
jgi:Tfp pilus assembly protein PilN